MIRSGIYHFISANALFTGVDELDFMMIVYAGGSVSWSSTAYPEKFMETRLSWVRSFFESSEYYHSRIGDV